MKDDNEKLNFEKCNLNEKLNEINSENIEINKIINDKDGEIANLTSVNGVFGGICGGR